MVFLFHKDWLECQVHGLETIRIITTVELKISFLKFLRCLLLISSVCVAWEILLLCFERQCFGLKWMEIIFFLQKTEYVDGKTTPPGTIAKEEARMGLHFRNIDSPPDLYRHKKSLASNFESLARFFEY